MQRPETTRSWPTPTRYSWTGLLVTKSSFKVLLPPALISVRPQLATLTLSTLILLRIGNVCYKLPGFHPMFDIPSEEGSSNHTPGFAEAARTPEAHNRAMKVAKGLAVIGAKFMIDDNFAKETREAFEKLKEEIGNSVGQSKTE